VTRGARKPDRGESGGAASSARPPAFLAEYSAIAEPRLRSFLDARVSEAARLPVELERPFSALREYVLRGGKRLRGALVVLGCEAAGGERAWAIDPSIGIELLHAYLLAHDDFMDRDEMRRGGPTLHAQLGRQTGSTHLGGSLAILLGSLCEAWALELVLAAPVPPERTAAAGRLVARALQEVTAGQMEDLSAPLGRELRASDVLAVQRMKTGSYTFELPLRLGAVLAGASDPLLQALARFARPLGQAFQIADDLLGTLGLPEVTGKPNASDLREGKRTLLVARALESASEDDAKRLRAGLGREDLSDLDADELRDVLVRTGAVQACRDEAERLCDEAIAALAPSPIAAEAAEALRQIARYAVHRAL